MSVGTMSLLRWVAPASCSSTSFTASMSMACTCSVVSLSAPISEIGARVRSSGMRRRSSDDGRSSRNGSSTGPVSRR